MTTRERKIEFIESFGQNAMITAITEYFYREGANWLTDEQLEVMVRNQVEDWKSTQRRNRENRARAKALADARRRDLREKVRALSAKMQCNCDLDNWQPEPSTGHSCVCRIHKAAVAA